MVVEPTAPAAAGSTAPGSHDPRPRKTCPICGEITSERAVQCPHCSYRFSGSSATWHAARRLGVAVVVCAAILAIGMMLVTQRSNRTNIPAGWSPSEFRQAVDSWRSTKNLSDSDAELVAACVAKRISFAQYSAVPTDPIEIDTAQACLKSVKGAHPLFLYDERCARAFESYIAQTLALPLPRDTPLAVLAAGPGCNVQTVPQDGPRGSFYGFEESGQWVWSGGASPTASALPNAVLLADGSVVER